MDANTLDYDNLYDFSVAIHYPNLFKYLDAYYSFYQNDYPLIVQFYSSSLDSITINHWNNLLNLIKTAQRISDNIKLYKNNIDNYLSWDIAEYFDDLEINLQIDTAISKFLRSSITNFNFNDAVEFMYTLKQKQTLENVELKVLKDNNYDDDWVGIAVRNDLFEVDYNTRGGNNIVLSINRASTNINIKSVIDNISGEKVYGLDLNQIITLENNDLEVLTYKQTIQQAVAILASINKGSVPEFMTMGLGKFVGGNAALLGISSITRQLNELFSTDDTLSSFSVTKTQLINDNLFITFQVSTRLDMTVEQSLKY